MCILCYHNGYIQALRNANTRGTVPYLPNAESRSRDAAIMRCAAADRVATGHHIELAAHGHPAYRRPNYRADSAAYLAAFKAEQEALEAEVRSWGRGANLDGAEGRP